MAPPPLPPDALTARPRRGTVALIDRTAITVADLTLTPEGVRVHKFTVSHNGRNELVFLDTGAVADTPPLSDLEPTRLAEDALEMIMGVGRMFDVLAPGDCHETVRRPGPSEQP